MKRLTKWDWAAITIILVGAGLRLTHLFTIQYNEPFRLGGLFYEFSRQIVLNDFAFPHTIPYFSAGGIPFAYPPLSFYVQAILLYLFNPPIFITVNLLPPIIALLSLPAFYWMIRQYTDDIYLVLSGLFAFALMPVAFMNQIEAAGLAESFGMVSLILYLGFLFRWRKHPNFKDTILAGLTLGLCILSSPGSAYAATILSVLLFIWTCIQGLMKHSLTPSAMLLILGSIGLVISSPYWLSVLSNHGVDYFVTPFLNQHQSKISPGQIEQILNFQPAGVTLNFIWSWLILAGLFWTILNRYFFIVVIFLTFWLIPREGIWLVAIPASILAGIGFVFIFFPLISKAFKLKPSTRPPLAPGVLGLILLILVLANAFFSIIVSISEPDWQISRSQIYALRKFQAQIPNNGKVIILGNIALAEWGPTILQREVLNTEYGLEWQPDELEKIQAINASIEMGDFAGMIDAIGAYTGDKRVYLVTKTEEFDSFQDLIPPHVTMNQIVSTQEMELFILIIE